MIWRGAMLAVAFLSADIGHPAKPAVRYFPARTFSDAGRRAALEYLVCPDPPADKSYEALAGMKPAVWEEFASHFRKGKVSLWLRWRGPKGEIVARPLERALPWAACKSDRHGIVLGNNHDESANALLPPDDSDIQVGIALKPPR